VPHGEPTLQWPSRAVSRRTIHAWMLYDFANSSFAAIVQATVFPALYANVIVGNAGGRGDFWWGTLVSVSMVLVAVSSPLLGGIADHAGVRKPFFVGLTVLSVVATALLATLGPGMAVRGFVLGVLGLVGYEGAIVYYNAYLPLLAAPAEIGRVSAGGFALGYAGSIVAFLAAWPFVAAGRYGGCFLVAAALFGAFALPAFVAMPADAVTRASLASALARGLTQTWRTLREIATSAPRRQMRRFLLAYLVYEDGVNTVISFSAVFAATTLGFSFSEIIALFMVVQVTALLGSAAWARATDLRGPRLVVKVTLVQWTVVTLLAYLVRAKWEFWVVGVIAGLGLGAIQAASRTLMATVIPRGREAEFFGFYALVGKTGAVLGPFVFGAVSRALGGNQRAAIVAVGAFFVVGLILLSRVSAGGPVTDQPLAAGDASR
jgi:MFS transporter, UMF1 family